MYSIYSLTPTHLGDDYRLVEIFETYEDAEIVLKALESVNISFYTYMILHKVNDDGQNPTRKRNLIFPIQDG